METYSQYSTTDRQPFVAGKFYPADNETLAKDISQLLETCKKSNDNWNVRAIICPHAGYVYSGKIAAAAYSSIASGSIYKNIFIIASSHVMSFDGASVYSTGDYVTLDGKMKVNREIANRLISENRVFNFPVKSHIQEHSIEVQLPFIQKIFSNKPYIVPIIIGTDNENTIKKIAESLRPWFTTDNLFIISSDFSHYPSYNDALETDRSTFESISSLNPEIFLNTINRNSEKQIPGLATSMCGWTSGLTLIYLAQGNRNLEIKHIDYCNSGDSPYGNKNEVVGYQAIALIENKGNSKPDPGQEPEFSFNKEEKKQIFRIARKSIEATLVGNKRFTSDVNTLPVKLKQQSGAFVTLKINGALRGCIGRFISSDPLYEVIQASALSSAFEDPRFNPLTKEEFNDTEIEITILGPMKKINNISEIKLGKHGIYIKKDYRSGTMLPQVATENGWSVEQFLGYTSRDKARIGWDGWKEAEIFIYEGVVLEENQK
jgi:hypothetical protein